VDGLRTAILTYFFVRPIFLYDLFFCLFFLGGKDILSRNILFPRVHAAVIIVLNNGSNMQEAELLDELTAILGSGRFKTLLKHLCTYLPSLRVAARQHQRSSTASAVDNDTHQQCGSAEDVECVQCDELIAEIEQRVTELEDILTRNIRRHKVLTAPRPNKNYRPELHHQVFALRHCMRKYCNILLFACQTIEDSC
jgi:hypothetical protein